MERSNPPPAFPRGVLLGAAALVVAVIVLAGVGRVTGLAGSQIEPATPVLSVELRFEDQPDGGVAVYDVPAGRSVALLAPGTNGFVRGVLRGMARERRQYSVGIEPPFRLTRWDNGSLSLEDPQTGRRIELGAFGATNLDAFARLLPSGSEPS